MNPKFKSELSRLFFRIFDCILYHNVSESQQYVTSFAVDIEKKRQIKAHNAIGIFELMMPLEDQYPSSLSSTVKHRTQ
jgi:hypothetical protein